MFTIAEIIGKEKLDKLKDQHDKYALKTGQLEKEIVNCVFSKYINENERKILLEKARALSFSKCKLNNIEKVFNDFNQDNITYNIAVDIIEAQKHVQEHNRESFFSKIANIVISEDENTQRNNK